VRHIFKTLPFSALPNDNVDLTTASPLKDWQSYSSDLAQPQIAALAVEHPRTGHCAKRLIHLPRRIRRAAQGFIF
jgi:hypothetical protein